MIVFFTKAPRLGFGKSRLKGYLTDEDILKLNKKLIYDNYEIIKKYNHCICYDGDISNLSFLNIDSHVKTYPQSGEGIGDRMKNAIFNELTENKNVLLVGSDLIGLKSETIEESYQYLSEYDAVITPVCDGGYGIIGMNKPLDLFSDITYSTESVYNDVLKRSKEISVKIKSIGSLIDIDNFVDLIRAELDCYNGKN